MESITKFDVVNILVGDTKDKKLMKFFYETLNYKYSPDINGYTFLFMVPPHLSGLGESQTIFEGAKVIGTIGGNSSYMERLHNVSKFFTFAAIDFTPPQEQLNTEKVSSRSGAIPYATEFTTSEQVSVTCLDDADLSIYKFHQLWLHYIWDLLEGKIKPHEDYIKEKSPGRGTIFNEKNYVVYGGIDYAAAFYIVKYKANLKDITYVGKCIGVFPQSLPSKELIGQRTSNELTTLPFSYFCAAYRGYVVNNQSNNWILDELKEKIFSGFDDYQIN